MECRQESGRPVAGPVGREAAGIGDHDERRQIVVQRAKSIAEPSAHRRESRQNETVVLHEGGRPVDVRFGNHGMDKRHVIDA